ncbi:hypothetical protein LMB54_08040 [Limosilactobacillus reuteri]|uniref:hypothetical protein n=1 Tax=Limosilactobacillus reuteri TaxID=1598 RepID=UPI001E3C0583|nr:hypothetical protein [Limosilactobacillus reuteri]MCC4383752.1 hypothetical protein [Limosilactobacillus reuteri]MCC4420928.1 hypothetical protein [Limosilactobacillus reuteri]
MEVTLSDREKALIVQDVFRLIKENYKIIPKKQSQHPQSPQLIGMETFRRKYCHDKAPAWVKTFILPNKAWAYGVNCGKGVPIKIDEKRAAQWLAEHNEEINWNQPLP